MKRGLFLAGVAALCVAVMAGPAPADQQRILVDVGQCWYDVDYPGFGPHNGADARDDPDLAHGPNVEADEFGNFWNNHSANPTWGALPINLVDTLGNATGMTFHLSNWAGCGDGGQVDTSIAPVSNLYPEKAQTDCRWWDAVAGGMTMQPGYIYLAGMDPGRTYDIGLYGYVPTGAMLVDDGPYPAGTTVYTIGAQSLELDVMDNTADLAWFTGVSPDASGDIDIEVTGGVPSGCGAVINVVEILLGAEVPRIPGDCHAPGEIGYGCVDGGDYTIWADNYGTTDAPLYSDGGWAVGNFTQDNLIDGGDYTIWADHYLQGCTGAAVPEPFSATLVLLAVPVLLRRRKG